MNTRRTFLGTLIASVCGLFGYKATAQLGNKPKTLPEVQPSKMKHGVPFSDRLVVLVRKGFYNDVDWMIADAAWQEAWDRSYNHPYVLNGNISVESVALLSVADGPYHESFMTDEPPMRRFIFRVNGERSVGTHLFNPALTPVIPESNKPIYWVGESHA